jgi:hypothetical protein
MMVHSRQLFLLCLIGSLGIPLAGAPKKTDKTAAGNPVIWRDPVDIASRNLVYGPGGEKDQPQGPFVFVKEDSSGTNPKFVIKDAAGAKWKLKLGVEVRAETAASRIVWAAGYFADEDYFLPDLVIRNVPLNLHRGEKFIEPDGLTHNARLKRYVEGEEKSGSWKWKDNPFVGTREFNGLRVIMALINNWDLKDVNNTVYEYQGDRIYLVSDLGSSFGTTGFGMTLEGSKGNLDSYMQSKFIQKVAPPVVDFFGPGPPALIHVVQPGNFKSRFAMEWIGKQIPIADARWLGQVLGRLTQQQIQGAFGAGGFSPKEVAGFSGVVESRIADLNKL